MNILNQLSSLKQIPSVVNDIIANFGSLLHVTGKTKKGTVLKTNLPVFSTFVVDNQTDNMYGLVEFSSKVVVFNQLGEIVETYQLPEISNQICVKGGILYALHNTLTKFRPKFKTNSISVHDQLNCKLFHKETFAINCDACHIENMTINADGTLLIFLWVRGLMIYNMKMKTIVKSINCSLSLSGYKNWMSVSATDIVYISDYSGNKVIRVPLNNIYRKQSSEIITHGHETIGSTLLCDPCFMTISSHDEIFVFHNHAWYELVIFSSAGKVINSIRMTWSQLQFRSNGALVAYNQTDGIKLFK